MKKIRVGAKIRFLKLLDCGPTEEHPAYVYAEKGELGEIVEIGGCREGFWVKTDSWLHKFGAERKEFECL
jgi:hypothetical protein